MIVSGYTLDLYCENREFKGLNGEYPYHRGEYIAGPDATYFDESRKNCWAAARKDGWKLNTKNRTAICPKCAAEIDRLQREGGK